MRSRIALFLVVVGTVVVFPMPASSGGGNWIEIRDEDGLNAYLVPGSERVAHASAYAKDPRKVREHGPYFAWLSHETYGWSPPGVDRPQTIRLGRLDINWNRMRASIRFTVPEIPPGEYMITFCNADCSRTFGDVDPTGGVQIFATALEARLTQRLDKLDAAMRDRRYFERRANRRMERGLNREIDKVETTSGNLDARVSSLGTAVDGLREAGRPQIPSWALAVAALLAGAAGFGIGRARTHHVHSRALDRELDELVTNR
jgi:hypothetical protein